jgi:superfamily II DNA/RNA helicase
VPTSFTDLGVPADLTAALAARGVTEPFPIQAASIPDGLAGHDLCGRAPTGSGKTLAFGVPLVARTGKAAPRRPRALVLAPTRELAAQIHGELAPLAAVRRLTVGVAYGGVPYGPQREALRRGLDVLVACPGRLLDLVQRGDVSLHEVDTVVVDEADRMADMGFLPSVRRLLDDTPSSRQTILFSATLDGDVAVLTRAYQRDPRRHEVTPVEEGLCVHTFWGVDDTDRTVLAADVIRQVGSTVVFCRTRHGADRLTRKLAQHGVRAAAIHGGRTQGQRDRALAAFADGDVRALVATDVAARGIHVDDVACVLHYDHPGDHKTYLHRSGRTSRAGAAGLVVSFVTIDQLPDVRATQRALGLSSAVSAPDVAALTDPTPGPSRPAVATPAAAPVPVSTPASPTPTPTGAPAARRSRNRRRGGRRTHHQGTPAV